VSESASFREKYLSLIDDIVQATLQGKISSGEQVYRMLLQSMTMGTGEIFEMALSDRMDSYQQQLDTATDEIKQAKASRSLRAMNTIQSQWVRAQEQNQAAEAIAKAAKDITIADPEEKLGVLLNIIDPNRKYPLNVQQLQQLSKSLRQFASADSDLQQIADGISSGVNTWGKLQSHLLGWMYERQEALGFGGVPGEKGPWALWAKNVDSPLLQVLFRTLAMEESLSEFADNYEDDDDIPLGAWVELTLVLQYIQRGLVSWFDNQPYNIEAGSKLSISTFLTFAVIWSQLTSSFGVDTPYGIWASRVMLQILRTFSQKPYFPMYGGIFASFSGSYLRDALNYLDEPLQLVEGTQEKARILTLLGYSQRALGEYERSLSFHQQALDIARDASDRACEIANLNHLSRTCVAEGNYADAIDYSQRALILSRQAGDKTGEANALANLGYSEVMQAQELEKLEPETYEMAINYLQQGLKLSEKLGDLQSKALCLSSLGVAYQVIEQYENAVKNLEAGFKVAQVSGDLYLQGLNLANLAEANYSLQNLDRAIYTACLGMYLLNQIAAYEWRKPAGLLSILQGQMGVAAFQEILQNHRPRIIAVIGVDGYDHIPQLIAGYQTGEG
jgi:tetratricopeptide (TPR) repeat protein